MVRWKNVPNILKIGIVFALIPISAHILTILINLIVNFFPSTFGLLIWVNYIINVFLFILPLSLIVSFLHLDGRLFVIGDEFMPTLTAAGHIFLIEIYFLLGIIFAIIFLPKSMINLKKKNGNAKKN